jgi:hypothetical protein
MRRTLMKIGAITFALTVLGAFMANAAISGCASKRASPEPATPPVKLESTELPAKPSAQPADDEEYLPATKAGTFRPRQRSK